MRRRTGAALLLAIMLIGSAAAANYIFERSVIKGVGYRSHELVGQTAQGYAGQKFAERISGSGNFDDRTEFELDVSGNYINFTQDASFDYFPVSYQTGTFDRKWTDKICVINYDAGAVVTESYTDAESLQKSTEVRTIGNDSARMTEVQLSSNVIGVAHIGWLSRETETNSKGRYVELGRSVEDLTGVFSIEKYIQLSNCSGNGTRVDWLPCF